MAKNINYSNKDIIIVWNSDLCTHAAECVKRLPKVYHPKERPWITIENTTTEELKEQISQRTSGALRFIEK